MTTDQLKSILADNFYKNFAENTAKVVVENNAVEELYTLATKFNYTDLNKDLVDKIIFRAAYVVETIYFNYHELFGGYVDRFFEDFSHTTNSSAKRHFSKIMAHLLKTNSPNSDQCEQIAEAAADWISDPNVRVAVKIWDMEILLALSDRVGWINEIMPEIMEPLQRAPSPAMQVRLRNWRKASFSK